MSKLNIFVHNVYSNLMKHGTKYIITHYTSQWASPIKIKLSMLV